MTLLGGGKARVKVPYLKQDLRGRPGRTRGSGKRGPGGTGLYPTLAALGIWFGVTPALAGEIVRQVADSDAVRPAREALARRGIDLGHKQTLRIVGKVLNAGQARSDCSRLKVRSPTAGRRPSVASWTDRSAVTLLLRLARQHAEHGAGAGHVTAACDPELPERP